jgi:hypothetical protein
LREIEPEVTQRGGAVVVISFAPPDKLAPFAAGLRHPYLWLSDVDRQSYRSLQLGRDYLLSLLHPRDVWMVTTSTLRGKPWIPRQFDMWQLGGTFVFAADGTFTMTHRCRASFDRPPVPAVRAAFLAAARDREPMAG